MPFSVTSRALPSEWKRYEREIQDWRLPSAGGRRKESRNTCGILLRCILEGSVVVKFVNWIAVTRWSWPVAGFWHLGRWLWLPVPPAVSLHPPHSQRHLLYVSTVRTEALTSVTFRTFICEYFGLPVPTFRDSKGLLHLPMTQTLINTWLVGRMWNCRNQRKSLGVLYVV